MRTWLIAGGLALAAAGAARADVLDFRAWLNANPATPNSTANEWFGTRNVNGAMLTSDGSMWWSPGFPANTPLLALRADVGTNAGAAGAATFDGCWAHPGSGLDAVLVFSPSVPTLLGRAEVRSELIANGLSGNGVTISVLTTISGVTTAHGSVLLAGTADARLDAFDFPQVVLQPGDRVHVVFGDNGSYLFDHVNFNVTMSVPTPAASAVLLLAGAGLVRRKRPV